MTVADKNSITNLYVTYFGRAPDPSGLNYWLDQAKANVSLESIAAAFGSVPESTAKYQYLAFPNIGDPTAFVTSIYKNAFNRTPEAEGLAYWVNQLNQGSGQVTTFILTLIQSASPDDKLALQNKQATALRYTNGLLSSNNTSLSPQIIATDSAAILDTITKDPATLTAGNTAVDAKITGYTSGGTANTTIPLTTSITDNLTGTTGNDTFTGVYEKDGSVNNTISATDKIDGSAGIDTFEYTGASGTVAIPTLVNVEKVDFLSPTTAAVIDFTGKATGLQQVTLKGGTVNAGTFTVKGLSGITLGVEGATATADAAPTTTVTSLTADFGSTATSGTVSIKDAIFTTLDLTASTALTSLTIIADGLGKNSITTLTAPKTTSLKLNGAGTIDLTGNASVPGTVTTIDASQKTTGGVAIKGGAATTTITGGAGADTIKGGAATTTITGGAGADTITGGGANTKITGGAGADYLTGGSGDVTYVYTALTDSNAATLTGLNSSLTFDTITDFVSGTDKIDISAIAGYTSAKWAGDVSSTLSANISLSDALIALSGTGGKLAALGSTGYFKAGSSYYVFGSDGIANTTGTGVGNDLLIGLTVAPAVGDFTFASA